MNIYIQFIFVSTWAEHFETVPVISDCSSLRAEDSPRLSAWTLFSTRFLLSVLHYTKSKSNANMKHSLGKEDWSRLIVLLSHTVVTVHSLNYSGLHLVFFEDIPWSSVDNVSFFLSWWLRDLQMLHTSCSLLMPFSYQLVPFLEWQMFQEQKTDINTIYFV